MICQRLRVPRYIQYNLSFLARKAAEQRWPYATTPQALVRAWEFNFADNGPALMFYPYFDRKKWVILKASEGDCFVLPDEPLIVDGPLKDKRSVVFLPLSPEHCFVAGPFEDWPLAVKYRQLPSGGAMEVSGFLASRANKTVIARVRDDSSELRRVIEETLSTVGPRYARVLEPKYQYWGKLSG